VVVRLKFEILKQWITLLGLGGVVGTVVALLVKAVLERRTQDHEHQWQEERERRDRTQDTDRATYNHRLTILVREHLAAFIRTGRWPTDEEDLRHLLASLSQQTYEHFLDPAVNQGWVELVATSVELARRRLSSEIEESDIYDYNQLRTDWEDACKRSFGPLPDTPEELVLRHNQRESESTGT
jgi:hypothetical protein